MEAWIAAIIARAVTGVRDLAQAAMERMLWLYGIVVSIGLAARTGWSTVTSFGRYWRGKVFGFAGQVYNTLWYIIHIRIPVMVNNAIDRTVSWTVDVVNNIRNELIAIITDVRNWFAERYYELINFVNSLSEWLIRKFAEVWNTLDWAADLVFMLLTSPDRMAAWLFGALIRYILSFLDDNAEALLDVFRDRATYYAGRTAARIEEVLVRLL